MSDTCLHPIVKRLLAESRQIDSQLTRVIGQPLRILSINFTEKKGGESLTVTPSSLSAPTPNNDFAVTVDTILISLSVGTLFASPIGPFSMSVAVDIIMRRLGMDSGSSETT